MTTPGGLMGLMYPNIKPGAASFPVVEGQNVATRSTATTSHPLSMPSGITSGETLLCFFFSLRSFGGTYTASLSGWTQLATFGTTIGLSFGRTSAWYKKAVGGDTGTITTSASCTSIARTFRISNAADPAITPPESTAFTSATSASPNSPLLTPTGGAKNYLWFTNIGAQNTLFPISAPTNYTNLLSTTVGGIFGDGNARRELNAASEDPGAFGASGSGFWVALTVAVHPV